MSQINLQTITTATLITMANALRRHQERQGLNAEQVARLWAIRAELERRRAA